MTDVIDVVCPKCQAAGRVRLDVLRNPIRCKPCGTRIAFAIDDEMHAWFCKGVSYIRARTTIDDLTHAIDLMDSSTMDVLCDLVYDESMMARIREVWHPTLRRLAEDCLLTVLRAKTFDTFLKWARRRNDYDPTAMFARVTDPRYRDALVEELVARLCRDDKPHVRTVLRALKALGWQPASVAERAHVLIARERYDKAAELGPEAVEPLARLIRYEPLVFVVKDFYGGGCSSRIGVSWKHLLAWGRWDRSCACARPPATPG